MEEEQVKKKSLWEQLQESKWKQVLFFMVSMGVLAGIFLPVNSYLRVVREKDIVENLNVSTDFDIWFGLDEVKVREEGLNFSGWHLRKNSKISRVRLILNAIDGSDAKIYFAENVRRKEAEEYFEADWEVGSSGFSVEVPAEEIELDKTYEVQLVLYYDKEFVMEDEVEIEEAYNKINTGWYLYNGELYRYDPVVFYEPRVKDEELQKVIEEGILRAYDLEYQLWIYQYENKIYYIAKPELSSLEEAQIGFPVMLWTNKPELLPEHRIQHGFDHLGFYYEDESYQRDGILPYYVRVVSLSDKYPTTYLITGLYNSVEEKWLREFRILILDIE